MFHKKHLSEFMRFLNEIFNDELFQTLLNTGTLFDHIYPVHIYHKLSRKIPNFYQARKFQTFIRKLIFEFFKNTLPSLLRCKASRN